jgi:hypothetical protein
MHAHRVAGLLQEKLGSVLQSRAHLQASLYHAPRNVFAISALVRFLVRQEEALEYEGIPSACSRVFFCQSLALRLYLCLSVSLSLSIHPSTSLSLD